MEIPHDTTNTTARQATVQEEKAMAYDLLVIGGHVSSTKALQALQIAHKSLRVSRCEQSTTAETSTQK